MDRKVLQVLLTGYGQAVSMNATLQTARAFRPQMNGLNLPQARFFEFSNAFEALKDELKRSGSAQSAEATEEILAILRELPSAHELVDLTPAQAFQLESLALKLIAAMNQEVSSREIAPAHDEAREFFDGWWPHFKDPLFEKLPDAKYDVEEGLRCLARGATTSGVFHLTRALEALLKNYAAALGLDDLFKASRRNWSVLVSLLNEAASSPSDRAPEAQERAKTISSHLAAMTSPYAGSKMQLKQKYSAEEATAFLHALADLVPLLSTFLKKARANKKRKIKAKPSLETV
jgi:hypothetical protein